MDRYSLRVVTQLDPRASFDKLEELLKNPLKKLMGEGGVIVLGKEIGHKTFKEHIHGIFETNLPKDTLRERIKTTFNIPKILKTDTQEERNLKNGNKYYSLKLIENFEHAVAYCLKDGAFIISPKYKDEVDKVPSWKVFPKDDEKLEEFEKRVKKINQEYLVSDMEDEEYLSKLLSIYSETNRSIYIAQIRAMWLGLFNKRNRVTSLKYADGSGGTVTISINPRQTIIDMIKKI